MSWTVRGFNSLFSAWVVGSEPSLDLEAAALEQALRICADPFSGETNGYFYYKVLPGCRTANGEHVTCTWTIHLSSKSIRFASFSQSAPPVRFDVFDDEIEPEGWIQ